MVVVHGDLFLETNDWLTDWLIDWLNDWLTDWLIDWLIDWLTDWLIDWLIDWLMTHVNRRTSEQSNRGTENVVAPFLERRRVRLCKFAQIWLLPTAQHSTQSTSPNSHTHQLHSYHHYYYYHHHHHHHQSFHTLICNDTQIFKYWASPIN